jgi:phosphatidate cytidylyltransferase
MSSSNLQLRVLTAAVGLPVVAVLVYLGGWPFAVAAAAIAMLAGAEFVHGWLLPSLPIPEAAAKQPAFLLAGAIVLAAHWEPQVVPVGAAVALAAGTVGYSKTNTFGPRKPYRVLAWCLLYLGVLFSTIVLVRDGDDGRAWLFLGLLSTFAVDTGAYAVGRAIGRHRMAPRISPGKTWEGAVGGYAAGVAAVFALNAAFDTGVSAATLAFFAAPMPLAAILGDLLESWMKRRMGVKDASGLLPGHGGFLDRLDSVLLVMPLLYLFLHMMVL